MIKNIFIKTMTLLMVFILMVCILAVASYSLAVLIGIVVSLVWIVSFIISNYDYFSLLGGRSEE